MAKVKPQLSLFENKFCDICGKKVPNNQVTCKPCAKEWVESITLSNKKVFKDDKKRI
jgi:predicted amidophosphoribosyltransferase